MPPTTPTQTPAKPAVQSPPTPGTPGTPTPETKVVACAAPVTGKKGTKPCVKDKGHEGAHSSRARNTIDVSDIKLDDVQVASFDEGERVTVLTDPGKRSEIQQRIDADVKQAYEDWNAHGKPDTLKSALAARFDKIGADGKPVMGTDGKPVNETVAKRYFVNPAQEAGWRKMLRSAATLHGCQVRIFPVQQHKSGRHQLPWFARDMRQRTATAATPATATPATTTATPANVPANRMPGPATR